MNKLIELHERLLAAIKTANTARVLWRDSQDVLNAADERLRKAKLVGKLNPNARNDAEIENAANWFDTAARVEYNRFEKMQDAEAEVARLRFLLREAREDNNGELTENVNDCV